MAEQAHWTERGRAASVCISDATGRPGRSVLAFGQANLQVQHERRVFIRAIRVIRGHARIFFCPRITPITRMPELIDAGVLRGPEAEPGCSSEHAGCVVVPCWMPSAARH